MGKVSIRRAKPADIAYVMTVEAQPGYAELVGQFEEAEHLAKLSRPDYEYNICLMDEAPVGFAVLKDTNNEMGNVSLHRIAVAQAGKGVGKALVAALAERVFEELGAYRFWLDVLPDNDRAKRAYLKMGFVEEGLMRSALRYPDGRRVDLVLMALLKPDWQAKLQQAQ